MRKHLLYLILLIPILSFGQKAEKIKGNKIVTIQETKIDSFTTIAIGENFKINLLQGKPMVKIETDENLHDVIEFDVDDNTLSFGLNKRITAEKKLNITVYYPSTLSSIITKDDAEVNSLSTIILDNLNLKTGGTSKVDLELETGIFNFTNHEKSRAELKVRADSVTISLRGNSKLKARIKSPKLVSSMYDRADAELKGEVDSLYLNLNNRSSFESKGLQADYCEILTLENSKATINISEELYIKAKDNSDINIYNDPQIILEEFTETATLHKRQIKDK
jgi:hypothetical protein